MNNKQEFHSKQTFQDTLSDCAELSGLNLSESMKRNLAKQFYKPELEFEPLCAVRYGSNILLLKAAQDVQCLDNVFSLNIESDKITQLA